MRQTLVAATALLAALIAIGQPDAARAQGSPFAARLLIDGKAISNYEYDQRLRFMRLLNAPGDLLAESEKTLIEDRLRFIAGDRAKIRLTPAQIEAGMTEFASRFEMELAQFTGILEANGVARATFRDFVHAGLVWREVVRARFGNAAPFSIYDAEVDRSLSTLTQTNTTRVLLSEILLPAARRNQAMELSGSLRGEAAFANAARAHSLGPTAAEGGRVDWRNAATLPQQVLQAVGAVRPGQVTQPVRLADGRYAIYLVRQLEERPAVTPQTTAVDYARLVVPGAGTPAADAVLARVQTQIDSCNDLNALPGQLSRETVAQNALPADVAGRIAGLDDNEYVTYAAGGAQIVLMLCSRQIKSEAEPDRDVIRGRLVEARVVGQADIYLQQLRSNAHIRRP